MAANRAAFDNVTFRPRMGEPPASISLKTTVLGQELNSPLLFAPCGLMGTMHPEAEAGTVRVAEARGTIAAISSYSSKSLEHIGEASNATKWFQLYFLGGRAGAMSLVERAEAAGYGAIVLTLDTNVPKQGRLSARIQSHHHQALRPNVNRSPSVAVALHACWHALPCGERGRGTVAH